MTVQTAHGSFSRTSGDLTSFTSPSLGFAPHSVFLLALESGTANANYGNGVVADDILGAQLSLGTFDEHGVSTASPASRYGRMALDLVGNTGGTVLWSANVSALGADTFTLDITQSDFAVDVYWWALNEDAGVGCSQNNWTFGSATRNFPVLQRGTDFVADAVGSFPRNVNTAHDGLGKAGQFIGDPSTGYFGTIFVEQSGFGTMTPLIGALDTNEPVYSGDWGNLNRLVSTSLQGAYQSDDTAAAGSVDFNRSKNNFADSWVDFFALAGRNDGQVSWGIAQAPSSDQTLNIPLGFTPRFFSATAAIGALTLMGDDFLSNLKPCGACYGYWSAEGVRCVGHVQDGVGTSSIARIDSAKILDFTSAGFSGSADFTPQADSADLVFTGLDGNQHYFIWFAFGESGGPSPFIADGDLVAEEAALSGAAILPVSALGAFVAEDAAMTGASNWTAPDFTAVGSFSAGESSLDGTAAVSEPVFDSSGDFQVSPALLSGLAEAISAPGTFAGSGAFVSEAAGLEGTAGFTPQDIVSSGAFTAELAILNGAASTFEEAVFPAAGAFSAELAQLAGSAITANTLIADGGFVCELASLRGTTFLDPTDELGIVIGSIATRPSLRAEVNVNDTG